MLSIACRFSFVSAEPVGQKACHIRMRTPVVPRIHISSWYARYLGLRAKPFAEHRKKPAYKDAFRHHSPATTPAPVIRLWSCTMRVLVGGQASREPCVDGPLAARGFVQR
jgi:hypothetical protein